MTKYILYTVWVASPSFDVTILYLVLYLVVSCSVDVPRRPVIFCGGDTGG